MTGEQLERLLKATTEGEPTGPEVRTALFSGARFIGHAHFFNTAFRGKVDFTDAVFTSSVSFHQASFDKHPPRFDRIHVAGWASFTELNFDPTPIWLRKAFQDPNEQRMASGVSFIEAQFSSAVSFDDTIFPPWVSFRGSQFDGLASWDRCGFRENVGFDLCRFLGPVRMFHLVAVQDASFVEARFDETRAIGPIFAGRRVDFQRTYFGRPVSVGASSQMLWLNNAIFDAGADVFVEAADVSVEEVDFGRASLLANRSAGPRVMRQPPETANNRWNDTEAAAL